MTTPTTEPTELRAGDSWAWRREDLTDYLAPTWTLTYRFKNADGGFEVVATADGTDFAVAVLPAVTAVIAAGDYSWTARVGDGTNKYTIDSGTTTVLPDPFGVAASVALDMRSNARKTLAAIDAMILGTASLDQRRYVIKDRELERIPKPDLIKWREYYANLVRQEDRAEAIANGMGDPRKIYVRFARG